ncbi:carboxypeptidase-like regulatory domain-containing protein [Hymenobacter siberiensis]|uniref:carboxypeptidase-like regulatory domain-containing protein n=1 Tax=Hymenobacter siberiensis TaxID=2848396 RepID=UPI001C1E48FE|nr:carboxypeptidase-like regulatory domain-containing protein [Hymenobacter siberiensis]MBU6123162.1 carboxypeptidase-like regulatory domain-containing protein [Hymenobacter siberiensis]
MRFSSSILVVAVFACVINLATFTAQAQRGFTGAAFALATDTDGGTMGTKPEKRVLMGKITNPAGPLPGAVVILTASKQMAVTNADGEFKFEVPANAGALDALVTYAGYADEKMTLNASADESTVSLTNARVIVVSRKQQLKRYLKTAHKQVKRDLRQVRQVRK